MDDTNQMAGRSNVCGFQEEGCLPIHMACMDVEENPNRLRRLIDMTSDVDARTENGLTALHIACGFGKYHLVRVLIEAGADVNARDKTDSTPLHFAVQGSNGAIKLLVEAGADVEAENAEKQTPLLLACTIGKVGAIENLCERGANVHLKTPAGVGLVFLVLDSRKSSMPSNAQAMTKAPFCTRSVSWLRGRKRSFRDSRRCHADRVPVGSQQAVLRDLQEDTQTWWQPVGEGCEWQNRVSPSQCSRRGGAPARAQVLPERTGAGSPRNDRLHGSARSICKFPIEVLSGKSRGQTDAGSHQIIGWRGEVTLNFD